VLFFVKWYTIRYSRIEKFPIDCPDKLLQIPSREDKADVADAMTLLESKQYPPFVFCGGAISTAEGKTQVGRRTKHKVSPSVANMCEAVPPAFPNPPTKETVDILLVFALKKRPIEVKHVDQ
jgi:hypothetical protein